MEENCVTRCLSPNYSSCVYWDSENIQSDCFTICSGDTLTSIIKSFADTICEINQTGKVKVNSSDACLGYLSDKLTSNDESITLTVNTDVDGCKTIDLSSNAQNILLYNNWTNLTVNSDDLMSFSMDPNTLSTNGDQLEIEGNLVWVEGEPEIKFYFDTSFYSIFLAENTLNSANVSVKISRISNTLVRWRLTVKYFDNSGVLTGEQYQISGNLTVSALSTNSITIKFTNISADDVTQQFMDIKLFRI